MKQEMDQNLTKLPSGWKRQRFGEFVELHRGYDLPIGSRVNGDVPVIGSNGIVGYHSEQKFVGPGVATGRSGTIGLSFYINKPYWPLNTALYVSDFHGNCSLFVHYYFQQFNFQRFAAGVSVPTLNRNLVHDADVITPPLPEQKKIAAVLSKHWKAVEAQVAIIGNLRELKKSMMNRLFTHGLRGEPLKKTEIGMMPKSWESSTLGEVKDFFQYGTSERCEAEGDGIAVLRIPNVIGGKIDTAELKYVELPKSTIVKLCLEHGDILFVRTNGRKEYVGRCAVYHGQPDVALFASYIIRARLMPTKANPDFVQRFAESEAGRTWLNGRASGAADGKFNINTQILAAFPLPLPSLVEQNEIVSILRSIDEKIAIHESKKSALEDLFKAMLNKLMTGKLRVRDLDIDTSEVELAT